MRHTPTQDGRGDSAAQKRIVPHPDFPNGDFWALLDVYGDLFRSHHGYVMRFTKPAAVKMLGVNDALI
jgi:hypothetical protein